MPPMMIAFLAAIAGGGFYLWNKNKTQATANAQASIPPIPPVGLTFDPGMTMDSQNAVNAALANENDPVKLRSLAAILRSKGYNNSANALEAKAAATSLTGGAPVAIPPTPVTVLVQPTGTAGITPPVLTNVVPVASQAAQDLVTNPSVAALDPGMSQTTQGYIAQALATEVDIPSLLSMATALDDNGYHNSAAVIRAKVLFLQAGSAVTSSNLVNSLSGTSVDPSSPMTTLQVQQALNILGTPGTPLTEDGISGPATNAAIVNFQTMGGITADGVPGPQTCAVLRAALGSMGKSV
jgi:murein L,D-transpeptidase YcbB/YkuD